MDWVLQLISTRGVDWVTETRTLSADLSPRCAVASPKARLASKAILAPLNKSQNEHPLEFLAEPRRPV